MGIVAEGILDVAGMIEAERKKSALAAQELLDVFEHAAIGRDVLGDLVLLQCTTSEAPTVLTSKSRLRDLTIVPVSEVDGVEQWYAEVVVFGAGRPVLVLPNSGPAPLLESVIIAWDASRAAARALADAMPILARAKRVSVVTVVNEKPIDGTTTEIELTRHLAKHGVDANYFEIDAKGSTIGDVLRATVAEHGGDLLVMGAYGHSRIRDFILGGATKSMFADTPVPLFLSH
jgi:nucleotide-binding universal stress UspA family protein